MRSPKFTMKQSGFGGTSSQVPLWRIWRPGTLSVANIVQIPQSVCAPAPANGRLVLDRQQLAPHGCIAPMSVHSNRLGCVVLQRACSKDTSFLVRLLGGVVVEPQRGQRRVRNAVQEVGGEPQ